jgi:CarD family transcriptional regulator
MFKIGDYIILSNSGICKIDRIEPVHTPFSLEGGLYYSLTPIHEKDSKIFLPATQLPRRVRKVMDANEAMMILQMIPNIQKLCIINEKMRESIYKETLASCDPKAWASLIKTTHARSQKRLQEGKRKSALDDRYCKMAEKSLFAEISFAIGQSIEETGKRVLQSLTP